MEIYNEEINDLLAPEHRKLQIHENLEVSLNFSDHTIVFSSLYMHSCIVYKSLSLKRGIYVAGLREEIVTCPEQVLDLMEFGECMVSLLNLFFFWPFLV